MSRRILSHLAHVELLTPKLEDSVVFFTNTLGLVESACTDRSVILEASLQIGEWEMRPDPKADLAGLMAKVGQMVVQPI